jgi:hypothetical protein
VYRAGIRRSYDSLLERNHKKGHVAVVLK